MYQDGTGTIHKRSGGGEFISPILNISKSPAMPIYVQFYMNTVLYRLVCIPFNGRFTAMFTSSESFMYESLRKLSKPQRKNTYTVHVSSQQNS